MTETPGQSAKRKLLCLASSDHQYGDRDYIIELLSRITREEFAAGFNAGLAVAAGDYTETPIEEVEDE